MANIEQQLAPYLKAVQAMAAQFAADPRFVARFGDAPRTAATKAGEVGPDLAFMGFMVDAPVDREVEHSRVSLTAGLWAVEQRAEDGLAVFVDAMPDSDKMDVWVKATWAREAGEAVVSTPDEMRTLVEDYVEKHLVEFAPSAGMSPR